MANNNFKIFHLKYRLGRIQDKIRKERNRLDLHFVEDAPANLEFATKLHALYKEADNIIGEIIDAELNPPKPLRGMCAFEA